MFAQLAMPGELGCTGKVEWSKRWQHHRYTNLIYIYVYIWLYLYLYLYILDRPSPPFCFTEKIYENS